MAMTLAQANLLTKDYLVKGIIETIIEEGGFFVDRLPFESITGEDFNYLRELTLPTVDWYDVNEVITESSPTHSKVTVTLKRMLGDADLDKFLRATKSDVNSLEAEYIRAATKNLTRFWLDAVIYGNSTSNTKSIDGLHALVNSAQVVNSGATTTGGALSLAKLDQLIDLIKPGKPDCLIMNKTIRRRLSGAARLYSVGGYITYGLDAFGRRVSFYDDIPIWVSDYQLQTETISGGDYALPTTGVCSSIWAVKFGSVAEGGLMGLQASRMAEMERIDPVPNKDSIRFRVKWYTGMALGSIYSLAVMDGVTDAAVTV